jgi:hypothetical protein
MGDDERDVAPTPPRTHFDPAETNNPGLYEAIALSAATGARNGVLAATFGYSQGGMSVLLGSPAMRQRVSQLQDELKDRAVAGAAKILLHLNTMIDTELKIALPTTDDPLVTQVGLPIHHRTSTDARRYLMDKVLAAKTVVTNINRNEHDPETVNTLVAARGLLEKLTDALPQRTTNIQNSPFVHEGPDAVPRPQQLGDGS